jgi:ATP-dependent DNA helicase PIF1
MAGVPPTEEQQRVVDLLLAKRNVLLVGAAGTGKTRTIEYVCEQLKKKNVRVACLAPTGLAALNMRHGQTIPRFVGLGCTLRANERKKLKDMATSKMRPSRYSKNMKSASSLRDRLRDVSAVVVDEASMCRDFDFEMLEFVLRAARGNQLPFGGVTVLASGDFRQLPPVSLEAGATKPFLNGDYMSRFERVRLTKVFRQSDVPFLETLARVGAGAPSDEDDAWFASRFAAQPPAGAVALFATNASCDLFNNACLTKLDAPDDVFEASWGKRPPGPAAGAGGKAPPASKNSIAPYASGTTIFDENVQRALTQAFGAPDEASDPMWKKRANAEKRPCPARTVLREGTPVMFRANVDVDAGLANGTTGVYVGKSAGGGASVRLKNGRVVAVEPYAWETESDGIIVFYKQLPLVAAFSCTAHKAQGQQFDSVWVDFSDFAKWPDKSKLVGMAYVAVSRATRPDGFFQRGYNPKYILASDDANAFYDSFST